MGSRNHRLTELAAKPKAKVNTKVNPRMNRRIGAAARPREAPGSRDPDTKAR